MENYHIPLPPDELFDEPTHLVADFTEVTDSVPILDHFEYPSEGGVLRHYVGHRYPEKGFPFPEMGYGIRPVKAAFVAVLVALTGLPGAIWSHKRQVAYAERVATWLLKVSEVSIRRHFKNRFYTPCANEVRKGVFVFFSTFGFEIELAKRLAKLCATVIEADTAYRYRLEDIADACSLKALKVHPRKELRRLIKLLCEREQVPIAHKYKQLGRIISLALLLPKVRSSFLAGVGAVDLSLLEMDDADWYHCLNTQGYNFGGLPPEDRLQKWIALHPEGEPPRVRHGLSGVPQIQHTVRFLEK